MNSVVRKTNTMSGQSILATAIALVFLSGVDSDIVTKCKSDDSDCALKSAKALLPQFANGLPEYKVKSVDPLFYKKIDASSNNLKLILTDVTVTGLKNCNLKKVKRDAAKHKLFLKLDCSCQLEGQYEMDGQLLILPIKGKGPLHVTVRKSEINIDVDMGEKEKNGVTYWDVKGWKYNYSLKDKSTVVFENLFDGNEVLAKAAGPVIAESGNEIILEVGTPVINTLIKSVVSEINSFFNNVPAKELSIA